MEPNKDGKRKKDRNSEEEEKRREKKLKRARSTSRSPADRRDKESRRKRKHSKSQSPDVPVKQEKESNASKDTDVKKNAPGRPERRAKETDMLNTRTGGAYIPPARLRMMQAQITDKSSVAYQRLAWEALKKSIHGHINKINVGNIGIIIKELLKENIVRGRGLLCRSVIQAQAASPTFTNVYAALVAAINSRFPNIGELLLKRLMIQFKRGFKRNDKPICISSASFIAHLVNQRVAHEILALELLTLLVESPTDDSVEVAIAFLKECGQKLTEVSSKGVNAIFEMLRNILHEGQLDKRVQYMIEVMFQVWKDGFKDHPALIEELELVPEEEQFTHLMMLDEATDPQDILNVFKFDEKYEENEQKYKTLSKEILGSDAESGEEDSDGESGSEESEEEEEEEGQKEVTIIDNTETNLVALRRTIYLTINSSLDFEECAHKLMKMQLKPGQEVELCHMFLDCCAEQRTYEKFYGLLAQRFCNINRIYIGPFEEIFKDSYGTAHRLDTNRLRNVSKFFAHLLFTDSISWEVLECVKLNEEDTTSSSRIYIKILFQELAEYMGLKKLNDRLKDPTLQSAFSGIFPRGNPKNTRFSINFFTSIGLGGLTDELREHLKQMPKNVPAPIPEITLNSGSSSDSSDSSSSSSSDSSSSDSSSSDSENEKSSKKKEKTKSKKTKNKDKAPKMPEDTAETAEKPVERWGHDGFYDTYGKDAKRLENRPQDRDNFARPRDFRRNDDRSRMEQRNGDDRRNNDDNRRRDGNGRDNDCRKPNDDRDRRNDDRARYDDNNRRNEDRTQRDDGRSRRDNERGRQYDDSRNRKDADRQNQNRSRNDDRSQRNENRSRREDDERVRDDSRSRKNDEKSRGDETNRRDDRGRQNEERSRRDDDRSQRDEVRSRRDEDRPRDENRSRKDDDKESRRTRDDDKPQRSDRENKTDSRSRRDDPRERDDDRTRRNEDRERRNDDDRRRDNDRSRKDDDRDSRAEEYERKHKDGRDEVSRRNDREVDDYKRNKKYANKENDEYKSRRKDVEDRNERNDDRKRDSRRQDKVADEDDSRSKRREKYQNGDDSRDGRNNGKDRNKDGSEEHRSKKDKNRDSTKDKKRAEKKRKEQSDSEDSSSSDSSSSSDESEESSKVPSRYWDTLDIKSKKEVIEMAQRERS